MSSHHPFLPGLGSVPQRWTLPQLSPVPTRCPEVQMWGRVPDRYQGFLPLPLQSHLSSRNICLTSSINTQLLIVLTIRKKTGALNVNYIYLDSKNFIT